MCESHKSWIRRCWVGFAMPLNCGHPVTVQYSTVQGRDHQMQGGGCETEGSSEPGSWLSREDPDRGYGLFGYGTGSSMSQKGVILRRAVSVIKGKQSSTGIVIGITRYLKAQIHGDGLKEEDVPSCSF